MNSLPPPISVAEARARIIQYVERPDPVALPLAAVLGRVLTEPIDAQEDQPAVDQSSIDGYAVAADSPAGTFRLLGEWLPGFRALFALSFCPVSAALFFGSLVPLALDDTRRGARSVPGLPDPTRPPLHHRNFIFKGIRSLGYKDKADAARNCLRAQWTVVF